MAISWSMSCNCWTPLGTTSVPPCFTSLVHIVSIVFVTCDNVANYIIIDVQLSVTTVLSPGWTWFLTSLTFFFRARVRNIKDSLAQQELIGGLLYLQIGFQKLFYWSKLIFCICPKTLQVWYLIVRQFHEVVWLSWRFMPFNFIQQVNPNWPKQNRLRCCFFYIWNNEEVMHCLYSNHNAFNHRTSYIYR